MTLKDLLGKMEALKLMNSPGDQPLFDVATVFFSKGFDECGERVLDKNMRLLQFLRESIQITEHDRKIATEVIEEINQYIFDFKSSQVDPDQMSIH